MKTIGLIGGLSWESTLEYYRIINQQVRNLRGHGLDVIIPEEPDRSIVHQIIYEELCAGVIKPESKEVYKGVIHRLGLRGAEGVLLGCTEIPLLVQQSDCALPLFDTTTIHAEAIAEQAVGQTVHVG
ncbi:aspartate/glutamate racemase family protein [Laceyella tengchongensis]